MFTSHFCSILKYPEKRRLRRKGSFGIQFFTTGDLRQELTAVSPICSKSREKGMHTCLCSVSCLYSIAQGPKPGRAAAPFEPRSSISIEAVKIVPHDIIQDEASTVI